VRTITFLALAILALPVNAEELDPLVGEFRLEIEPLTSTHKFWKDGQQYYYAPCSSGKCQPGQSARLMDESTLAGWFQPGDRWKTLGARAITADGTNLAIFYVERPDDRIKQRTSTNYLFNFWVLSGSAEKLAPE
jgi:hypothetical protein